MKALLTLAILLASSVAQAGLVCDAPWGKKAHVSVNRHHARIQFNHWRWPDLGVMRFNGVYRNHVYYRTFDGLLIVERSVLNIGKGRVYFQFQDPYSDYPRTERVTVLCR